MSRPNRIVKVRSFNINNRNYDLMENNEGLYMRKCDRMSSPIFLPIITGGSQHKEPDYMPHKKYKTTNQVQRLLRADIYQYVNNLLKKQRQNMRKVTFDI